MWNREAFIPIFELPSALVKKKHAHTKPLSIHAARRGRLKIDPARFAEATIQASLKRDPLNDARGLWHTWLVSVSELLFEVLPDGSLAVNIPELKDFLYSSLAGACGQGICYAILQDFAAIPTIVDFMAGLRVLGQSCPPGTQAPDYLGLRDGFAMFHPLESKGTFAPEGLDAIGWKGPLNEGLSQCATGSQVLANIKDLPLGSSFSYMTSLPSYALGDCVTTVFADPPPALVRRPPGGPGGEGSDEREGDTGGWRLTRLHYASWFTSTGNRDQGAAILADTPTVVPAHEDTIQVDDEQYVIPLAGGAFVEQFAAHVNERGQVRVYDDWVRGIEVRRLRALVENDPRLWVVGGGRALVHPETSLLEQPTRSAELRTVGDREVRLISDGTCLVRDRGARERLISNSRRKR